MRHQPATVWGWIILTGSLDDRCGRFSVCICLISRVYMKNLKRERWTHPQHQRWLHESSQQFGQRDIHGCSNSFDLRLLFTKRSSIHQSINRYPPKSRGGLPQRTEQSTSRHRSPCTSSLTHYCLALSRILQQLLLVKHNKLTINKTSER